MGAATRRSKPSANGKHVAADESALTSEHAERQILGGAIRYPGSLPGARELLKATDFSWHYHQLVFSALCGLHDKRIGIDPQTTHAEVLAAGQIVDQDERQRIWQIITDLWDGAPTGENAGYYAEQVAGLARRRRLVKTAERLRHEALSPSGPVEEVADRARAELQAIARPGPSPADNPLIAGAMDCEAFEAAEFRHDWVIGDVMVAREPLVLAGPSKSMKTGLVVEAAVSMAAGRSFLDLFPVDDPVPVFVISAESGPASLQARARQVCRSKGIDPAGLPIRWYTRVESLATVEGCRNLQAAIRHFGSRVAILDPSYLLLGGEVTSDSPGNMFAMGKLLATVGTACLDAGATPIVVTHSNGRVELGKPMGLEHIAWSGFQQWARQWWLVSRRTEYQDDGRHELLFRFGGSAGHTGLVNVDIEEGTFDRAGGSRKWDVRAQHANDARKAEREERDAEDLRQLQDHADKVLAAMATVLATGSTVATRNAVKDYSGLKPRQVAAAIERLIGDGAVIEGLGTVKCGHGSKPGHGIRRPDGWAK